MISKGMQHSKLDRSLLLHMLQATPLAWKKRTAKPSRQRLAVCLGLAGGLLCFIGTHALAFTTLEGTWPNGQIEFNINYSSAYDRAFVDALKAWSPYANIQFSCTTASSAVPCLNDGINSYGFSTSLCGTKWNDGVLAVSINHYDKRHRNRLIDTDILINAKRHWGIHTAPYSDDPIDFSRVAVHEVGHALGLGHSKSRLSVMYPYYSEIRKPYPDDINGIRYLYGKAPRSNPLLNCRNPDSRNLMPILSVLLLD